MERLDYILILSELQQFTMDTQTESAYLSDHSIPSIWLKLQKELHRGPGRWMLNTSYLDNDDYIKKIREIITEYTNQNDINAFLTWELIKVMSRGYSIQYGVRKAKSNKQKLIVLERKLQNLETEISTDINIFSDQNIQTQIALVKKDIEEIRAHQTNGAMLRAKASW